MDIAGSQQPDELRTRVFANTILPVRPHALEEEKTGSVWLVDTWRRERAWNAGECRRCAPNSRTQAH